MWKIKNLLECSEIQARLFTVVSADTIPHGVEAVKGKHVIISRLGDNPVVSPLYEVHIITIFIALTGETSYCYS